MLLKDLFEFQPKSSKPASYGKSNGIYPFHTSSEVIDKYADDFDYDGTYIVIGDGGTANCKYVNGKFSVSDHNYVLKPNKNTNAKLVYYFLKHDNYRILANGFKGVGLKNISKAYIQNIDFNVRNDKNELAIVSKLDNFSKGIEIEKKLFSYYEELIKSRFIEMFGDPLNKSLHNKKFTECVCFNPKKNEVKELKELEVSFVPMECVGTDGSFSIKKDGLLGEFYKGYTYFRDGDVLLAKITPCFENGKIAIAKNCKNGIGFGTTEFHVSRPISGISNSYWIQGLLQNDKLHQYGASKMIGSAGQKRIQTPFFENLNVFLPPIEDQNEFGDFVKQIDKLRFISQKRIAYLEELLNKEMDEAFN